MGADSSVVPEAAGRRFAEGSFSSGLSVADFAACLEMGLEPVALVQGFCAMQWSSYATTATLSRTLSPFAGSSGYVENYQCPHGMISAEHRMWGQNYQQPWIEEAWLRGFSSAYDRMLDEAVELGAHGVVGVIDTVGQLSDAGVIEFHLRGTAVRVRDVAAPGSIWTTYLAGQRLAKVFEAGYAPVSIVASVASVRVWAYCITEYLMHSAGSLAWNTNTGPVEIDQIVSARTAALNLVREHARTQLHGDALHGVQLAVNEREFAEGDLEIQSLLRANRIRRVTGAAPVAPAQRTVRLS